MSPYCFLLLLQSMTMSTVTRLGLFCDRRMTSSEYWLLQWLHPMTLSLMTSMVPCCLLQLMTTSTLTCHWLFCD